MLRVSDFCGQTRTEVVVALTMKIPSPPHVFRPSGFFSQNRKKSASWIFMVPIAFLLAYSL